VPVALCFGSFVAGLAAEVAFLSLICAYAGSLVGFASGVAGSLLFTLRLGSSLLHQGGLGCSLHACRHVDTPSAGSACWMCGAGSSIGSNPPAARLLPPLLPPQHPVLLNVLPWPAGTLAASALASCALRGAEGVGRLAAPLMLGLLRTLALRR
jgi:hypothetical protein